MGGEMEREEWKTKAPLATIPDFNPKSKVTQSQIDKFKELNRKFLEIKDESKKKINLTGNLNTRKRACVELEYKASIDGSMPIKRKESEKSQLVEPAKLEEPTPVPQKYKRKLHWGLDAKERWERKSNM